jgi:hypothetical protein
MAYKLIALDLDGTLLYKGEVSAENAKWIEAALEAGKKVVLSTGRPIHDVRSLARRLKLNMPLVINNGSEVWLSPDELHVRHELDPELVARLFRVIEKYGGEVDFWAHTTGGKIDAQNVPDPLHSVKWLQFAVRSANPDHLREIREEVAGWNRLEISNSHVTNIEFNPLGVSKASGLKEVCRWLGISLSEAIAVGDSLNDIPMIRAAGLGVAMGNAQEPVKRAADAVAPPCGEDGVAWVIKEYLLSIP